MNRYGYTRDMSRFSRDIDDFVPPVVPGHGTRDIRPYKGGVTASRGPPQTQRMSRPERGATMNARTP